MPKRPLSKAFELFVEILSPVIFLQQFSSEKEWCGDHQEEKEKVIWTFL